MSARSYPISPVLSPPLPRPFSLRLLYICASTACHGRPQPKSPLECYIKDKGINKEEFDKLSVFRKQKYEKDSLLSLKQYQEVPNCTLSA